MNITLIIEFIKEILANPVTRWAIIILTLYIWIVQLIGFQIRKLFKKLFCKKKKSNVNSIDSLQGDTLTAIKDSPVEKRTMKIQNGVQLIKEMDRDGYIHLQLNKNGDKK